MARIAHGLCRKALDDLPWMDGWRMKSAERQRWSASEWKEHFNMLSHKLSLTLRHEAQSEGIRMRRDGSIAVRDLLAKHIYKKFTEEGILACVAPGHNRKERFELTMSGGVAWVRARQGHSQSVARHIDNDALNVRMTLESVPRIVIHDTYSLVLSKIRQQGLTRFTRQHIHMAQAYHLMEGLHLMEV